MLIKPAKHQHHTFILHYRDGIVLGTEILVHRFGIGIPKKVYLTMKLHMEIPEIPHIQIGIQVMSLVVEVAAVQAPRSTVLMMVMFPQAKRSHSVGQP